MSGPTDPPLLTPEAAQAAPTWRAAYSDRTAALMAAFAELAYTPFEGGVAGLAQMRAQLAAGGFDLIATFNASDTQAYLATRPGDFSVLAFRGTTDLADWKTNANAVRGLWHVSPTPMARASGPAVWVHEGFLGAWNAVSRDVRRAVDALPPDVGLYITGHSLGGALAQIAAAALERDSLAACYTFGSPRVATAGFDEAVKCPHYRVVNDWDLVPGAPLASPWGYQHGGDPRLLPGGSASAAIAVLRRDRGPVARIAADLAAAAVALVTHRLAVIDEHMIWAYRAKLEAIAKARAP